MKYVTGFFMAWGNFFAIPCPYKKWDENCKGLMLTFLPVIGAFIGVIFYWTWLLLNFINAPLPLTAVILTAMPFVLSGFIHLDGFMDCMDGILSRRSMEERQRILKDPHVGSFAVVTTIILFLLFASSVYSVLTMKGEMAMAGGTENAMKAFILVPVISRIQSVIAVFSRKPMNLSQYNAETFKGTKCDGGETKNKNQLLETRIMKAVILTVTAIFFIYNLIEFWNLNPNFDSVKTIGLAVEKFNRSFYIFAAVFAANITHYFARKYAQTQLGGMSGDVSGFAITVSEGAAFVVMALL